MKSSTGFIKVRILSEQTRDQWVEDGVNLLAPQCRQDRYTGVAISSIGLLEQVFFDSKRERWSLPPSPLPDNDPDRFTGCCVITLKERVLITQESLGQVEQLIEDAK